MKYPYLLSILGCILIFWNPVRIFATQYSPLTREPSCHDVLTRFDVKGAVLVSSKVRGQLFVPYYSLFQGKGSDGLRQELQNGKLTLYPHEALTMKPYQWSALPSKDKNWRFQFQSLRFLRSLFATRDPDDLQEAIRWLVAWSDQHSSYDSDSSSMAWYPHGAAYRTLVISYAYTNVANRLPERKEVLKKLEDEVRRHAFFLAHPRNFEHTNHGVIESVALIEAQKLLNFIANERSDNENIGIGLNRLFNIFGVSISKRGIHMEHSPTYHFHFLSQAARVLKYLNILFCADVAKLRYLFELKSLLIRMYNTGWYLTDLNGNYPPIGDSEVMPVSPLKKSAEANLLQIDSLPSLKWSQSTKILFDQESGYAIYKDTSSSPVDKYAVFNIQKTSPIAHRHNDAISLYFQLDGVDIFTDSGKYSYAVNDPLRSYMTSRYAHNTAEPINIREYVLTTSAAQIMEEDKLGFVASIDNAKINFKHQRKVLFPAGSEKMLQVFDSIESKSGFALKWHLGSDFIVDKITVEQEELAFVFEDSRKGIWIRIDSQHPVKAEIVSGLKEPHYLGWQSKKWGEVFPAKVLHITPAENSTYDTWQINTTVFVKVAPHKFRNTRISLNGHEIDLAKSVTLVRDYFKHKPATDYYSKSYQISGLTATTRKLADELLHDNTLQVKGFEPFRIPNDPTWAENPYNSRIWQRRYNLLSWVRPLAMTYLVTGDVRYFDKARFFILDWIDNNVPRSQDNLTWHDEGSANRLQTLLDFWEHFRAFEVFDNYLLSEMLFAFKYHGDALMDASFYSIHTNHGLFQSLALAILGSLLPELPEASAYIA